MSETENKGEFMALQKDESQVQESPQAPAVSQQEAPASNPGSDNASAGIGPGSGGVSSTAYIGSPLPNQQKSVVESTVDTVKSYLANLSLFGGGKTGETSEEARNAGEEQPSTSSGAAEGATAGAATTAATGGAVAAGSDPASTSSASTEQQKSSKVTSDAPTPDSADSTVGNTRKHEVIANREKKDEEAKKEELKTGDETGQEKGQGKEAEKAAEDEERNKKPGAVRENQDSIPTAGGERLGEKHWGESKMVPDVPKKQDESKVSSGEGQPDKQTEDNTSKNMGSAGDSHGGSGEEKTGTVDKIKEKLGMGGK